MFSDCDDDDGSRLSAIKKLLLLYDMERDLFGQHMTLGEERATSETMISSVLES